MKIKYLLTALATVAFAEHSFAQYSQDALRFSSFQPGATARIRAIGNAGTAVGGDISSVGNNPAGLGFFTRSELSITPEYNGIKVKANYLGNNMHDSKNSLNLSNASVVFYSRLNTPRGADKSKGWLSANFGIAYNRTNNFYENVTYGGRNNNNSITNYYANLANSNRAPGETIPQEGTLEGIAYDQNLIDLYGNPSEYRSNMLAGVNQSANIIRTGGQSEVNFSFGLNHSNNFYLGASVGLASLRYNTNTLFSETGSASILENNAAVTRPLNSSFEQDQVTKGSGVNVKIGAIFKPVESLRIGALFTSPTWYSIDDVYSEQLRTRINGGTAFTDGNDYPFKYNLRTPLKVAGGLAYFIGKYGFISGDVEYMDYSSARVDYSGDQSDNSAISSSYKSVVNSRFGAEARLASSFFLRGGYNIQGNPLRQGGNDTKTVSGGLGYRFLNYYVDATYTHVKGSQTLLPYDIGTGTPSANLDKQYNNVYLTVGLRF